MDEEDREWKLISSTCSQDRDLVMPMNLQAGNYIAIIQAEWKSTDHNYDLNFRWTGYNKFDSLARERLRENPNMFNDIILVKAAQKGKWRAIDEDGNAEWMRVTFKDALLWVDVIRNNSEKVIYMQSFIDGSTNIYTDKEAKERRGQILFPMEPGVIEHILYRAIDIDCDLVEEEPAFQ